MSSRDPASWDTRLGNSTFSFDALSLQQGFYLCPGCQTPGLASATLTPCVQGQGGSASTLRSGISRPHLQHSGIHVPERRKGPSTQLLALGGVHMRQPPRFAHPSSEHQFPAPAACFPSPISPRLSPGYQ